MNALECFLIYMEDASLECISYTNLHGRRLFQQFNAQNNKRKVWKDTNYEGFASFVVDLFLIYGLREMAIPILEPK